MNVIIKIFDANSQDQIDEERGRLTGLGYAVQQLNADQGLDLSDPIGGQACTQSHDNAVALVASKQLSG